MCGMDGPLLEPTVARATVLFVRRRVKFSNFIKVQPYYFEWCHRIVFETSKCAHKNQKLLSEATKKITRNQPKSLKILSKSTKKPNIFSQSIKQSKKFSWLKKIKKSPSKSTKKPEKKSLKINQKLYYMVPPFENCPRSLSDVR